MSSKKFMIIFLIICMLSSMTIIENVVFAEDVIQHNIVEAEQCDVTDFKILNIANSSDNQSIVSSSSDSILKYEIKNEQKKELYLWVRAFGEKNNASIEISIDGKNVKKVNVYSPFHKWSKISLGNAKNSAVLQMRCANKNICIDQFVVTDNAGFSPKGIVSQNESAGSKEYYPENSAVNKYKFPEMRESNGSYYAEAEDGLLVFPMSIGEVETASNEKYAYSVSGRFTEPYSISQPHCGFKFNVKEKGTYKVWVRYYTPTSTEKSSWISVDGKNYYQLDTSVTSSWVWKNTSTVDLDVGWHTLDVKYRQSGHRLDCFIITKESSFSPTGLGSLPGEEVRPATLPYEERKIPRVYLNGNLLETPGNGEAIDNNLNVPIRHLCDKIGVTYYLQDDSVVIYKNRDYIKISENSDKAIFNGKKIDLKIPAKRIKDEFFANFAIIAEVFDLKYTIDENNQIYCDYTASDEIKYDDALANEAITVTAESTWMDYSYKCPENVISVDAYVRTDGEELWVKGYSPVIVDGEIKGSFCDLRELRKYTMKLCILTENGLVTEYKSWQNTKLRLKYDGVKTFAPNADELLLVPTYNNISCYIDYEFDNSECDLFYRKKGTEEWTSAFGLYKDSKIKQFRGTITGLEQGTSYEVKAEIISGPDKKEYISETKMWEDNPPIAKEYKLSELYDPNKYDGALDLQYLQGDENGWIKIKGEDGDNTIDASKNTVQAVWIANCKYVILENLIIKGGYKHAVHITNNSSDIRILNCDISGYGIPGILNKSGLYRDYANTSAVNQNAGVRIDDTKNITIERCFIHSPAGRTNSWTYGHPEGMNAVAIRSAGGAVIRYNDFVGNEYNRWNDVIESYYNDEISGGTARDCDIYGNVLMGGNDDGLELDGGQMNARVYNNLVQGVLCGISTVPAYVGPTYVFKNVFTNLSAEDDGTGRVFKSGGSAENGDNATGSWSPLYMFNNTMATRGVGIDISMGWSNTFDFQSMSRNNIIQVRSSDLAIRDKQYLISNDLDYDLISTFSGANPQIQVNEKNEKNAIYSQPGFVDFTTGRFDLLPTSNAIDSGVDLKDFTKGYLGKTPDMGAIEYGDNNSIFPLRPIGLKSDKNMLFFDAKTKSGSFEIYLSEDSSVQNVKILMTDFDKQWLDVSNDIGEKEFVINPGEKKKINVTAHTDKLKELNLPKLKGMAGIVFKLDDGYSMVLTIYYREDGALW